MRFDQVLNVDIGHVILMVAIVGIILFYKRKEGLDVSRVNIKPCHSESCLDACYRKAQNGELYGCGSPDGYVPFSPDECNLQYRKCVLHGCGVN